MKHLEDVELVDAAEGRGGGAVQAHLDRCASCRKAVDALRSTLHALEADAPQLPPPVFWNDFSARVNRAIDVPGDDRRGLQQPWSRPGQAPSERQRRWMAGLAAAAVLALVAGLSILLPRGDDVERGQPTVSPAAAVQDRTEAGTDLDADEAWAILRTMAEDLDLEDAREAGVVPAPGAIERAAMELSDEERSALVRMLQEEMKRTDS